MADGICCGVLWSVLWLMVYVVECVVADGICCGVLWSGQLLMLPPPPSDCLQKPRTGGKVYKKHTYHKLTKASQQFEKFYLLF